MQTFSDVLALWPSRAEVAADCGVSYGVVKQWWRRESVPPEYWTALIDGARKRGIKGLNSDMLAGLAASSGRKVGAA